MRNQIPLVLVFAFLAACSPGTPTDPTTSTTTKTITNTLNYTNTIVFTNTLTNYEPLTNVTVVTPTLSILGGVYDRTQIISITCPTAGATIYYTLDGSLPSTGSAAYTAPLALRTHTTLKTFAYRAGIVDAQLVTAIYVISNAVYSFVGSGDSATVDGSGASASFTYPPGTAAFGSNGDLFVLVPDEGRIRKIDTNGLVSTFTSSTGYDAGTGPAGTLYFPSGVAFDSSGMMFVADNCNHLIRKVTAGGVITTFAGSNVSGGGGGGGSNDGTGTAARFSLPSGVVCDSLGNVFVSDTQNNKIRKITSAGVVTTYAGSNMPGTANGTGPYAAFILPQSITIDSSDNLYVAEGSNTVRVRIRKIASGGVVTTLAGSGVSACVDGTGTGASFANITGLAVDSSGNVIVTEIVGNSGRVRKVTSGGVVTTIAGHGSVAGDTNDAGTNACFRQMYGGVAVASNGCIFVSDYGPGGGGRVRKIVP